ncbi:MAG: hypothetical protein GKR94_14275 [Gammaproteobacteria bacterium]|nr:hypothetical protein [Gammaproteobacteria bacterium]
MAWFEKEMEGREYVAGNTFSIADITAVGAIDFARAVSIGLGEAHPCLRAWHGRVAARSSYDA